MDKLFWDYDIEHHVMDLEMKICLVTFDFPPFVSGGISTQSYELASYLSREGIYVHVLTTGEEYEEAYVGSLFKITRLKVPFHSKLRKIPAFQFKVWRWLLKNNESFDVIHFQERAGFFYFLFNILNKRNDNTVESFHHSHVAEFIFHVKFLFKTPIESIPYLLFAPLSAFEQFFSLKKAKHVVTISNMSRSVLLSWGINSNKIAVIPNAISELSLNGRGEKLLRNNPIKFLHVGRLVPRKGIDILINAINILSKKGIDNFYVDIVGEGPLLWYCKKKIEKNNLKNITMWGLVPQQKLDELYREANCFIFPSRLEGFGIVLLEAAANNLAIIANDIPVFKEIYSEDEVLYFKQNDPTDLAEKILELCNKPSLISTLSKKAFDRARNYAWPNILKSYIDLYLYISEDKRRYHD